MSFGICGRKKTCPADFPDKRRVTPIENLIFCCKKWKYQKPLSENRRHLREKIIKAKPGSCKHCSLFLRKASIMDGTQRKNIQIGSEVEVVQKHHQRSGELTQGIVKKILTNSSSHPHGIKVLLEDGIVGRVKSTMD